MTYAFSWALQQALFEALSADPVVAEVAGGRVWDQPPPEAEPGLHVLIGEESVEPWSTATERGAAHDIAVSVIGEARSFGDMKRLAGAVCEATLGLSVLRTGRVVDAQFRGGRARRATTREPRRIDLRFRVTVEDE